MNEKELKEKLLETKELVKEYVDKTDKFLLVTEERTVIIGSGVDMVSMLSSLIANLKGNGISINVLKHAYELGVAENPYEYITKNLIEEEKKKLKEMEEFLK